MNVMENECISGIFKCPSNPSRTQSDHTDNWLKFFWREKLEIGLRINPWSQEARIKLNDKDNMINWDAPVR